MKKLIFAVMAIIVMAAPIANAQKANKEALVAKLAKVDADSQDAKKGAKAITSSPGQSSARMEEQRPAAAPQQT